MPQLKFKDLATYSDDTKTAVSIRDGYLEYYGSELGLTGPEASEIKIVKRDSATVANAAMKMQGIPVTNEHVTLEVPADSSGGVVLDAEAININEDGTITFAVKNKLKLSDGMQAVAQDKRELSLGYYADLVPCLDDDYADFEQKNIIPHHLAIVAAGRCGDMCSFIDRKPNPTISEQEMKFKFIDAEGQVDLQMVIEVITMLPEAIRNVPLEKVQEIMPQLQELVASSQEVMPEEAEAEGEVEAEAEVEATEDEGMEDEGMQEVETEDEMEEDEEDSATSFSDSKEFKDAVAAASKAFLTVVNKAKDFLDADYDFVSKSATEIMADAVKAETGKTFTDAKLEVAFELLEKTESKYKDFGDRAATTNKWEEAANKNM